MECKKTTELKYLRTALLSLGFPILGLLILSCSHSMYIQEKMEFVANQPGTPFKESPCVKLLDMIGCISLLVPVAIWSGILFVKIWRKVRVSSHDMP